MKPIIFMGTDITKLKGVKGVFFDFDGTIVDSVDIKTKAFEFIFKDYGADIQKKVVEYHLEHGGISRYDKFGYYYKELLDIEIDEEDMEATAKIFSNIVIDRVIEAKFIDGALNTLGWYYTKDIPMFLLSGTPQNELIEIVVKRGIRKMFEEIIGSPINKVEEVSAIMVLSGLKPYECVYFGDSIEDMEAAEANKVKYIGIT